MGARLAATAESRCPGHQGERLRALCAGDVAAVLTDRQHDHRCYELDRRRIEVFFEYVAPPRELLIAGRHHDVRPLVELGRLLGWEITVAASATPPSSLGYPDHVIELDPAAVRAWAAARAGAAIVVMTHSLALDRELIGCLLPQSDLAYLGLLGPRRRAEDILHELASRGSVPTARAELRAPVGLDLGGDGPEAVALSIAAELQAVWNEASARPLAPPLPREAPALSVAP